MRKYTIKKVPGATLQYYQREILQKDWNDRIEHGRMPTLREFARDHGLAVQTWKREYERGRTGETVPDPKRPGRKIYALYDAGKAQDNINEGHANKGAPMKVTNKLDAEFALLVKERKLSPFDAVCHMKENKEPISRAARVATSTSSKTSSTASTVRRAAAEPRRRTTPNARRRHEKRNETK